MTCDANKYGIRQVGALGQEDVFGTDDTRASIAHPEITTIDTDVTIFLNMLSVMNIEIYRHQSPGDAAAEGPMDRWQAPGVLPQTRSCEGPYHQWTYELFE